MAVIVVLMHDHDRRRAVDHRPFFLAGLVDHPVVPAGAADGEIRDVGIAGSGEEEEVASCGTMKLVLFPGRWTTASTSPAFGEFKQVGDIVIPALAEQNKFILCNVRQLRFAASTKSGIRIMSALMMQSRSLLLFSRHGQLKHGRDQRRAVSLRATLGRCFTPSSCGSFGETCPLRQAESPQHREAGSMI